MQVLFLLLFGSLLFGQLGALPVAPGITLYAHDIVVSLILGVGAVTVIQRKKFLRPQAIVPILFFIIAGCISLILNVFRFSNGEIGWSSLYLLRWCLYAGLYVLLMQEVVSSKFLFRWLYIFGTGISIAGLFQYILYPELRNLAYLGWDPHFYRLFSILFDPNFAGIIIVLTIILGVYLTIVKKSNVLIVTQVINVLALYLTYSRSSYLAAAIAAICFILCSKKWKLLVLFMLVLTAIIVIPTPGGKTLRLTRIDSTIARIQNWQESVRLIQQSPVIGYGFNTLRYIKSQTGQSLPEVSVSKAGAGTDSSILFLMATTGILGTIIYIWLYKTIFRIFAGQKHAYLLKTIFLCVASAVLTHSLFVNSMFYAWVMVWLWIFSGACELYVRKK
jgi:O-antigen ligase